MSISILNTSFAVEPKLSSQKSIQARSGQVIRNSNLLNRPSFQSDIITRVKADEVIGINSRTRAWYFISTAKIPNDKQLSGWISMLNIRFIAGAKREGELGVKSLFSNINNDSLPTISTGVRGFDEDELKNAKADLNQLALLKTYAVSRDTAMRFAQQAKLQSNKTKVKED